MGQLAKAEYRKMSLFTFFHISVHFGDLTDDEVFVAATVVGEATCSSSVYLTKYLKQTYKQKMECLNLIM